SGSSLPRRPWSAIVSSPTSPAVVAPACARCSMRPRARRRPRRTWSSARGPNWVVSPAWSERPARPEEVGMSQVTAPELPAEVTRVLEDFVAAARAAFLDHLQSIVLYGSAAEGALRPTSDVNVILVLRVFERDRADRLRAALAAAHAAVRLDVMFLLADEVDGAAEAFAQKFDDVRRRHRVLWGADPFAALAPSRAALLRRLDQVLLNLTLRLRAAYVARSPREEQLVTVIADAAAPLRTAAASL